MTATHTVGSPSRPSASTPRGLDPRGPQFAASLTSVVLIAALAAPRPVALALVVVQAVLFGIGAWFGVQRTPYAWLFRTFLQPRLGKPSELEDPRPPQFAQGVGFVFATIGAVGYALDVVLLGQIAVGLALVAALLNAIFRFCLGCEMYLLIKRATA